MGDVIDFPPADPVCKLTHRERLRLRQQFRKELRDRLGYLAAVMKQRGACDPHRATGAADNPEPEDPSVA